MRRLRIFMRNSEKGTGLRAQGSGHRAGSKKEESWQLAVGNNEQGRGIVSRSFSEGLARERWGDRAKVLL